MTGLIERSPARPGAFRRGVRPWLVVILLGLIVGALVWIVAFSSVLGVATIQITGGKFLSTGQLKQAAAIKQGTPLVRLDTAAVRRRLQALPEVRSAQVKVSYPNSVIITVIERTAVGYRSSGGVMSLVDSDNVDFRRTSAPPAGLPRLLVSGDQADDAAAAQVAGSLPKATAAKVGTISVPSSESITLVLVDGRTVLWGGTDRNADKGRLLSALLGQPGKYFDVSDPDTVISRGSN
jgi:cell division protein FtsQ